MISNQHIWAVQLLIYTMMFPPFAISGENSTIPAKYIRVESEPVSMNSHYKYDNADCVTTLDKLRICKGYSDLIGYSVIEVSFPGKTLAWWSSDCGMGFGNALNVYSIDFLKNGHFIPVMIDHYDYANGIGTNFSRIDIYDRDININPTFLKTEDFTEGDFGINPKNNKFTIKTAEYINFELVERWFYYEDGHLAFDLDKPILKGSDYYDYDDHRHKGNPHPTICSEDPWLDRLGSERNVKHSKQSLLVTDLKIIRENGLFTAQIKATSRSGNQEYQYPKDDDYDDHVEPFWINRLGDLKTKRLYPGGYIPANFPIRKNTPVVLESIIGTSPNGPTQRNVLWF